MLKIRYYSYTRPLAVSVKRQKRTDNLLLKDKTTIKINTRKTHQVAYKVDEPEHKSVRREMGRGRLLFYVSFDKGIAYLDVDSIKQLLNIQNT